MEETIESIMREFTKDENKIRPLPLNRGHEIPRDTRVTKLKSKQNYFKRSKPAPLKYNGKATSRLFGGEGSKVKFSTPTINYSKLADRRARTLARIDEVKRLRLARRR